MSFRNFATPWWFLLLIAVAALVVGYLYVQRLLRKRTLRFANLELLERVAPNQQGWIRHVPAIVLIIGLVLLTTAMAGPTAQQKVPRNRATVMLVIDVSLSMEATDVAPTRLKAAQVAAKSFAEGLTPGVNLGLITFAGTATVLVAPTTDRVGVAKAIDNLKLAQSTATGEAIFAALQAIEGFSQVVGGPEGPPPARIVLMSDGKQTIPTENEEDPRGSYTAAKAAADKKIPITTISFGTKEGTVDIEGRVQSVAVDDTAMKEIADLSGGDFYRAATAEQLRKVYDTLGEQIGYEIKEADASKPWLVLGTLAALIAAGSALLIGQRLP
ncbi:Ca-activated chloride channel family protein [Actinokineospora alba]|uniref:Ca-activated chloride channel family protein n=2 Tax=Actinokineospora TaxID=39845 RepID=A0A1H0WEK5_9PSEU|nr:VWA domain-containing protein [Actinokineospora alba]TDP68868.1 Ca-activated chloride channel family protein [Actinokineospora alba]SDI73909.1 Ca-activated chloride channel family protein [Actinokineospora alba]SDP88726.1 Ca-activated chloride channel family protein [Actinokineospora alba]